MIETSLVHDGQSRTYFIDEIVVKAVPSKGPCYQIHVSQDASGFERDELVTSYHALITYWVRRSHIDITQGYVEMVSADPIEDRAEARRCLVA